MKLNKRIIVPALALLAGASLAGSVTGTIAWYQYSTRANASYIGTSAGTVGNLQIRLPGGEWENQIRTDDVLAYLTAQGIGQEVEPVTPGNLDKDDSLKEAKWQQLAVATSGTVAPDDGDGADGDYYFDSNESKLYKKDAGAWAEDDSLDIAASAPVSPSVGDKYFNSSDNKIYERSLVAKDFYLNPRFGVANYENWLKANESHYVKIPFQLRFIEGDEAHLTAQNVYLSKLLIQKDTLKDADHADHGDLSDAVRVHFSVYEEGDEENAVNRLVSKQGGTTHTHGKLRIGNGSDFDRAYSDGDDWGFEGSEYEYVNYGAGEQVSYKASNSDTNEEGYVYDEEFPASGWKEIALPVDAAEPNDANGADGDFYFDSNESKLYQKAAGAWALFSNYVSGAADPDLETENPNDYDYFFKAGENKLFLRGFEKESISPILVKQGVNPNNPLELGNVTGRELGQTVATAAPQKYLNCDVTIWVEGWQKFNRGGEFTSLWDSDLIGAYFDVGMQFAVQDLNA